jgi:hypothetical protein
MLELKRDRTITGERVCPACRAPLSEQAVICIRCGLNLKTGKPVDTQTARSGKGRPVKAILLLLLASGAAIGAFLQRDWIMAMYNQAMGPQTQPEPMPEPIVEIPAPAIQPVVAIPVEDAVEPEEESPDTIADLLATAQGYKESVTAALRRSRPLAMKNFTVELCLISGLVKRGSVLDATATHVTLRAHNQMETIPLAMIDPGDRLICDPCFRYEWIHFRSIAYARNEYADMGREIPAAHIAAGTGPDETAIELGEPSALLQAARQQLADRTENKDLSHAFLYLACAALQQDRQAQYQLGRMYFNGVGAARNKQEGLRWISLASAQGHGPANAFLQQQQFDGQIVLRAQENARQRQEQERLEHAARLEELRARDSANQANLTAASGFKEPRRTGRSLTERYPHWTDSRGQTYMAHPDGRISKVVK